MPDFENSTAQGLWVPGWAVAELKALSQTYISERGNLQMPVECEACDV